MASIIQNSDGSTGIGNPTTGGAGEFTFDSQRWAPTSLSGASFVASRPYQVKSIIAFVEVAGTDAGAVTAVMYMAPSGTALASGTPMHSGTINLKGAANTNQPMTLTTPLVPAGYRVGLVYTGVLTAAVGGCTLAMCPV